VLRRLALPLVMNALLLAGAVMVAAPAEARNIGGTQISDAACVPPGGTQYGSSGADLPCVCAVAEGEVVVRVIGRGPSACPAGVVQPR